MRLHPDSAGVLDRQVCDHPVGEHDLGALAHRGVLHQPQQSHITLRQTGSGRELRARVPVPGGKPQPAVNVEQLMDAD